MKITLRFWLKITLNSCRESLWSLVTGFHGRFFLMHRLDFAVQCAEKEDQCKEMFDLVPCTVKLMFTFHTNAHRSKTKAYEKTAIY